MTVPLEDRVKRIDPATNAIVDTVRIEGGPGAVAIGADAVWVTSLRSGTVTRIDPRSVPPRATHTVRLGHSPQGVAVTDGAVWVAVQASPPEASPAPAGGAPDVLTVLSPEGLLGGTDPASSGGQVPYATCAHLLNYPERPFPDGARPQPEVAAEMPRVTGGGRIYSFRVRSGFRFSPPSNAPVTADAFRRAIERAIHPGSLPFVAAVMTDIVGAAAYNAGRAKHIAGITARGDTLTIRLTAPSATLPARMATTLTCAVPPPTPISGPGTERIPMAGPYYIASYVPKRQLLLRRNPNYHGPRHAEMREIQIDLDVASTRAVDAVDGGSADYVSVVPPDRVVKLEQDYGSNSDAGRADRQRYFSNPRPVLHSFVINTRRPLFAGTRMRRALNFALDHGALARLVSDERRQAPGRPHRPVHPARPARVPRRGDLSPPGPDLESARRLAGDRRRSAVLYTCNLPSCVEQGREARRNLAAVGIDVEVEIFSLFEMFRRLKRPGEPWDIGFWPWGIAAADPSDFIAALYAPLGDDGFPGGFSDKALGRRLRAALPITDTAARARAFAQLDADFARAAAAAPFATSVTTDFFSDRIGCQVYQPIYGISLGALCVRR